MSGHHFLFTYSVSPNGTDDKEKVAADKVRKKIAELNQWEKLEDVETAFVGRLSLSSSNLDDKRSEAVEVVKDVLRDIVEELDAYSDVWINVALSVDGLGKHIEFKL